MRKVKTINEMKDISTLKIVITSILLILVVFGYVLMNKYISTDVSSTEKDIVDKTGNNTLEDDDALKLANEKYYLAMATVTNTKNDIDKLYNAIEPTNIILEDQKLIDELNKFNTKTYTVNSSVQIVSNYDEAITKNFTSDFINNNILVPNGFIGIINNDYYIVKDKIDNYFFKKADLNLISKTEKELHFKVVNINYSSSCASASSSMPSITCTETNESDAYDFKLIKDNDTWKISEMTLTTA